MRKIQREIILLRIIIKKRASKILQRDPTSLMRSGLIIYFARTSNGVKKLFLVSSIIIFAAVAVFALVVGFMQKRNPTPSINPSPTTSESVFGIKI